MIERDSSKTYKNVILKLGKLAFVDLQKNHLIFLSWRYWHKGGSRFLWIFLHNFYWQRNCFPEVVFLCAPYHPGVFASLSDLFLFMTVYLTVINNKNSKTSSVWKIRNTPCLLFRRWSLTKLQRSLDIWTSCDLSLDWWLNQTQECFVVFWNLESQTRKRSRGFWFIHWKALSPDCSVSQFQAMVEMRVSGSDTVFPL